MSMMPNGQADPLLLADPHIIIRQLAELKMHLELELMQRDAVIEKLYARVKELESTDLAAKMNGEVVAS